VGDFSVSDFPLGRITPFGLGLNRTLIYGVGVSETVELGKREPRAQAADMRLKAASKRVLATLAERVADARLALARVVYARARQQALEESFRIAAASAAVAKGRLDHQALSGVDYDRLLIDLTALQAEVARATADTQSVLDLCSAKLRATCDDGDATIGDMDIAANLPDTADERTLDRRVDLQALRFERQAAAHDAILAEHRSIPDLTFRLGYTHDTFTISGDNLNSLSLSVALPIPVFDHGQHDATQALAKADELDQVARAAVTSARGEVAALFTSRHAIEHALSSVEDDMLPLAISVLAAQEKGLAEGQLDMTDLLLARRQAITLRTQALDLRFELFNVKNDLRRVLGLDAEAAQQ